MVYRNELVDRRPLRKSLVWVTFNVDDTAVFGLHLPKSNYWGSPRKLEHSGATEYLIIKLVPHISTNLYITFILPNESQRILNNNQITGILPSSWSSLAHLSNLYIFLQPTKFFAYPSRQLQYNQITGSIPPSWGQLTNLTKL